MKKEVMSGNTVWSMTSLNFIQRAKGRKWLDGSKQSHEKEGPSETGMWVNGRTKAFAYQVQGPEFKPQCCQKNPPKSKER
jgi:hypothetical protein